MDGGGLNGARLSVVLMAFGMGMLAGCAHVRGWGSGSSGGGARGGAAVSIPLGK